MLTRTFQHVSGVGAKTEAGFWEKGVTSWNAIGTASFDAVSPRYRQAIFTSAEEGLDAMARGDSRWFASRLPSRLHWRMFREFRSRMLYLDIETTGSDSRDSVTTIATWDGATIRTYVRGRNLDRFPKDLSRDAVLVTYSGKSFDVPVLERTFGIRMDHAHLDLRYILGGLGLKGGLKGVERQLGIVRAESDGLDGMSAVHLWNRYRKTGEPEVLETLLAYNIEDTVILEKLAVIAWNRLVDETPFGEALRLPEPRVPEIPCRAAPSVVAWLREVGGARVGR